MSGEDPRIRNARDRFEKRLVEHGVPQRDARREAIKQAVQADKKKR